MMNYEDVNTLKQEKEKLVHEMVDQCKQNGNINTIDTYAHTIKNMCKIIENAEQEMNQGYSGAMYSGYYQQPASYSWNPDYSGARGRGPQASRDSMGRYSSHGDMKASLYEAMSHASNDTERQQIQNLINQMG